MPHDRLALPVQHHQPCRQIVKHGKGSGPAVIRLMVQQHGRRLQRQRQFHHEQAHIQQSRLRLFSGQNAAIRQGNPIINACMPRHRVDRSTGAKAPSGPFERAGIAMPVSTSLRAWRPERQTAVGCPSPWTVVEQIVMQGRALCHAQIRHNRNLSPRGWRTRHSSLLRWMG